MKEKEIKKTTVDGEKFQDIVESGSVLHVLHVSVHLLLEDLMEFTRSWCAPCTAPSLPQGSYTSPPAGNDHPLESVYVQSLKTEADGRFRIPFIPGSVSDAFNGKFRAWILTLERVDGAVAGIYALGGSTDNGGVLFSQIYC